MVSCDVTRRALAYGAADEKTGLYSEAYAENTIRGSIQPKGATPLGLPMGRQVKYDHTFYTKDIVYVGDQIKDVWNRYYRVEDVQFWNSGDRFEYRICGCTEYNLREGDKAATSGTWHLDSDSTTTDPRHRMKSWLDAHAAAANIKLADAATNAATHSFFAGSHIHLPSIFLTKALDGVFAIDKTDSKPRYTPDHHPYAFDETVQVYCYALDKSTVTGANLYEQMEQEVRHVATDYPLGSIRKIDSSKAKYIDVGGGVMLWETTVTIDYIRANDDYVATYPTLTWGPSASPTGTYIFPNMTSIRYLDDEEADAWLQPPNYTTAIVQALGDTPLNIEITCDLAAEHSDLTWKRPQTTTPKTDKVDWQVFWDNKHYEGISQDYHTLTLTASGPSLKVRLLKKPEVNDTELTLLFREYTTGTAAALTTAQRYGLS